MASSRLIQAVVAAVAATTVVVVATFVLSSFHAYGLLDLQVYRMGGEAILQGSSIYGAFYQHDALPFTYSPFAAVVFIPLHLLGWTGSAVAMTVASLAALVRSCVLVLRSAAPGLDRVRILGVPVVVAVVLHGLAAWPARSTFEYGQINLVLLWLVVEDVLGAGRTSRWSGTLTGLAAAIKLTPAFFIVFFVVSGQRRRAVNAGAAVAAAVIAGFVVAGDDSWSYWTRLIFDSSRVGNPAFLSNQSLNGALARFAGHPPGLLAAGALALVAGAAVLAVARSRWVSGSELEALAAASIGPLLVSPISWSHHWVWMTVLLVAIAHPLAGVPGERIPAPRVRLGLVALVVTVSLPRPMTLLPSGGGRELGLSPAVQVLASAYVWTAVAVLAHLHGGRRRSPPLVVAEGGQGGVPAGT